MQAAAIDTEECATCVLIHGESHEEAHEKSRCIYLPVLCTILPVNLRVETNPVAFCCPNRLRLFFAGNWTAWPS